MQVIKIVTGFLSLMTIAYGCVFPYDVDIIGEMDDIIIQGHVSDQEGYHYVQVSRTVPLDNLDRDIPVAGCQVTIQDDEGNVFPASEPEAGLYACWIASEFLTTGSRFQLTVTTPEGKNYISQYDELLACPPIESIAWEIEPILTDDPDITHQGVRFYVSTNGSGEFAKNFRWVLNETWEYHSAYRTKVYYDGEIHVPDFSSDTIYYCWDSCIVNEVFTYSTRNLGNGMITKLPLNLVSDRTDKLAEKYSLLVTQMALSPTAYEYWNILEDQSKQTGDLFEVQPSEIVGNILSLDDENKAVNGLFYAASLQKKRIIIQPYIYTQKPLCKGFNLPPSELMEQLEGYWPGEYPVYLIEMGEGSYDFTEQSCFDCTKRGGTTVKPDYW